jgi:hypothetical protein
LLAALLGEGLWLATDCYSELFEQLYEILGFSQPHVEVRCLCRNLWQNAAQPTVVEHNIFHL